VVGVEAGKPGGGVEDRDALVKVSCPHCAYSAMIDRGRIPAGGAQARCPKCKQEFFVGPAPAPAPAPQPPAPPPPTRAPAPPPPPHAAPRVPVASPAPAPPPAPTAPAAAVPPAAAAVPPAPAAVAEPARAGKSGKENRQYRRIPYAVDVLINKAVLMKAIDISQGGLYVHTGRSFAPGSVVDVELPLGTRKISVRGRVQHNQTGVGMGIKFVDLTNEQQSAIFEFMHSSPAEGKGAGDARKRVLLIDEDALKRRMSKSKLILEGFSVVEVEDGFEAIRRMEEEAPDLVILDLFMRKMDGFKVLTIIKESPKWKDIPVLIYASKGTDEIMEKVLAAGATEFLLKMMTSPTKLVEIVKRSLGRA
jgi:predicted Zn finger-like uncharacterized protein